MKLTPVRTLPLRVSLRRKKRRNARQKSSSGVEKLMRKVRPRDEVDRFNSYLAGSVHPYALLGHQVSNWISGYLWARDLKLPYLGPTLNQDDTKLFDFSQFELQQVPPNTRRVQLPATADERDQQTLLILNSSVERSLSRRRNRGIRFELSLDQARWDQTQASDAVRAAFLRGSLGEQLEPLEADANYIAVHVRRPARPNELAGPQMAYRWVDESWHVRLIASLRASGHFDGVPVRVYSLGDETDFPLLSAAGVDFRLNGDRDRDFLELSAARLLVVAPSSFSFNAALVSRRPALVRVPWWHHVPSSGRWVPIDEDGRFAEQRLIEAIAEDN